MSKRQQEYMKYSFVHPINTKKKENLANLLKEYVDLWILFNGHQNDFVLSYTQKDGTAFVSIVVPRQAGEAITYLWYKAIYFLFPNASMWGQPCSKDGKIKYDQ